MYGLSLLQLLAIAFALGLLGVALVLGYALIAISAHHDRLVARLSASLGRPPTLDEVRAYHHEVPAAVLRSQR